MGYLLDSARLIGAGVLAVISLYILVKVGVIAALRARDDYNKQKGQ